jgi:hypothetical protein
MNITNEQRNWIIGGIVLVVVLAIGWWLFTKPTNDASTNTQTNTQTNTGTNTGTSSATNTRPTAQVNTGEEVHADDQPAGDRVIVSNAKISRSSWLAVRDDTRIYGARRVDPVGDGQSFNDVEIPLLRNTESGTTYRVVVYVDDGDKTFDFKKDALVDGLDDTFTAVNGD